MFTFLSRATFTILFFLLSSAGFADVKPTDLNAPIVVNVTKSTTLDVPEFIQALGTLSAVDSVTLSSEVSGRIAKIYFKNGQTVGAGMPVLQLDNSKDQATYDSYVAELDLSRHKYERAALLLNQAISAEELETLKANVAADEANVKSGLVGLNQKEIQAPFAGVLGAFNVQVGDYVSAGDPLVSLVNSSRLRVDFNIPQDLVSKLKQGQLVNITVDAYPHKIFYGTVSFIAAIVSKDTRSIAVEALVPNPQNLLSSGMFVHVAEQVSITKNAIVVPQDAVLADITGYYVYVVHANKVSKVYVQLGTHVGTLVQITNGLSSGETIVSAGQQKLSDGSIVAVVSAVAPPKATAINARS